MNHTKIISSALLMGLLASTQTLSAGDNTELAKKAQNPISNMISLPLQDNTEFNIGPDNDIKNTLNIQPVVPLSLGEDWNLINRVIMPVVSSPDVLTGENGYTNGIGDTTYTGYFSPKEPTSGGLIWGVGPAVLMPTATPDALGADKWAAGPSIVLLTMKSKWVYGLTLTNVWSFAGSGDQDINLMTFQYFINYNFSDGWYASSAPIITANWEADDAHRWMVPFGLGGGKIFKVGSQAMNFQLHAYYNAITPDDYGSEFSTRVQLQFLFPN